MQVGVASTDRRLLAPLPCCRCLALCVQALGSKNILCVEDLIHEILTVGPAFKEASNFLWPFKMNRWGKADVVGLAGVPAGGGGMSVLSVWTVSEWGKSHVMLHCIRAGV
jgi:hypothetical protein